MRNVFRIVFMVVGWLIAFAAFLFDLYCAYLLFGFIGIIAGIFIFPVLLAAIPFFMLFKYGIWLSIVLTGASIICLIIAALLSKDEY